MTLIDKAFKAIYPFLGFKIKNDFAEGVFYTGKFEGVQDCKAGLLYVKCHTKIKEGFLTGLSISTLDDGVWVAPISDLEKFYLPNFVESFNQKFCYTLPTEDDLNLFLRQYGMYGCFSG